MIYVMIASEAYILNSVTTFEHFIVLRINRRSQWNNFKIFFTLPSSVLDFQYIKIVLRK